MEPFRDPVVTPDGNSFERTALLDHLRKACPSTVFPTCSTMTHFDWLYLGRTATTWHRTFEPLTRSPLRAEDLIPNLRLRLATQQYLDQNPWAWGECIDPAYWPVLRCNVHSLPSRKHNYCARARWPAAGRMTHHNGLLMRNPKPGLSLCRLLLHDGVIVSFPCRCIRLSEPSVCKFWIATPQSMHACTLADQWATLALCGWFLLGSWNQHAFSGLYFQTVRSSRNAFKPMVHCAQDARSCTHDPR